MAIGKQNLEAQYAKALQIGRSPEGFSLLKQAALGQNDDFDQIVANMALKALTKEKTAMQGVQAQQQLAQGKQTVRDKILAEADQALPELLGIGQLPAPNMEALAAADGGIVGYADGGEVARYAEKGAVELPPGYEMYTDPTSGEVYPRKKYSGFANWLESALTPGYKKTPEWKAQMAEREGLGATPQAAAHAAPAAPAPDKNDNAAPAAGPSGPQRRGPAAPAAPAAPGVDPYEALLDKWYARRQEANAPYLEQMKEMLAEQKQNIAQGRKDALGIMALRAAAGLATPGQAPGLFGLTGVDRAFSGAAEEGGRAINLQHAGQQALTSQRLQAEQLRGGMDKADFQQALDLAKLKEEAKYHTDYIGALRDKISAAGGGSGRADISAALNSVKANIKAINDDRTMSPAAKQIKLAELYQAQNQLLSQSLGRVGVATGSGAAPKGAIQYEQ